MRKVILIGAFISLAAIQPVAAKVSQSTSYSYFKVQGHTAREIYVSLLKHAKGPGGHDAYATTTTRIFQKSNFIQGKICRFNQYNIMATFKITLPKLVSANVPAQSKQGWNGFATVLKNHEEHHRDLWMGCVRSFEKQVAELQAKTCGALAATYKKLWKTMQKTCTAQNNAFDKQEQLNFLRQPFIQMVLRGK